MDYATVGSWLLPLMSQCRNGVGVVEADHCATGWNEITEGHDGETVKSAK